MTSTAGDGRENGKTAPEIEDFLGEPTRDLENWAWLWAGDHAFPVRSHRGGLQGRLFSFIKRLLSPVLKSLLADHRDRQRVFNLILLEKLAHQEGEIHRLENTLTQTQLDLGRLSEHQQEMQQTLQGAIEDHARLLEKLDRRLAGSMTDVLRHNDALFARVDQKLDRYRQESRELWHRLGALIAAAPQEDAAAPGRRVAQREQEYLELEKRYRGSEREIEDRIALYLPHLEGLQGEVLDLGCGRGEALEVLERHRIAARGVDTSREMVERCTAKGLLTERAELIAYLAAHKAPSLGAIVSFHVIEHLPAASLERLVRLAYRALLPGGVLILETPSPLSVVTSARNFWVDPTHRRPVHPASLEVTFREAGFEPVHRLDLHPFSDEERLPEIDLASVAAEQKTLADHVNRLRDLLDDLLFGYRDFGMIGVKPSL